MLARRTLEPLSCPLSCPAVKRLTLSPRVRQARHTALPLMRTGQYYRRNPATLQGACGVSVTPYMPALPFFLTAQRFCWDRTLPTAGLLPTCPTLLHPADCGAVPPALRRAAEPVGSRTPHSQKKDALPPSGGRTTPRATLTAAATRRPTSRTAVLLAPLMRTARQHCGTAAAPPCPCLRCTGRGRSRQRGALYVPIHPDV